MQPTPEDVPNLWKLMDSFQAQLGKVHESLTNPEQKKILGDVLGRLQEVRAQAEQVVPESVKGMQAAVEKLKTDHETLVAKIKQGQEELEAKKKAQKPAAPLKTGRPPSVTERPESSAVPGDKLRDELLTHGETKGGWSSEDEHEIWEDWTRSQDLDPNKGKPPPPEPKQEKPAKEKPPEPPPDLEEDSWTTEW